jgi:hypothetical protein
MVRWDNGWITPATVTFRIGPAGTVIGADLGRRQLGRVAETVPPGF